MRSREQSSIKYTKMVNLAKPRKVNEGKPCASLVRRAAKGNRKIELRFETFDDIVEQFESIVERQTNDNQTISNAVRRLLSSLKSWLGHQQSMQTSNDANDDDNNDDDEDERFAKSTNSTIKCLAALNRLVSIESAFPETITLSALCIAFLLIAYFTQFALKLFTGSISLSAPLSIRFATCYIYFSYYDPTFQVDRSNLEKIENKIACDGQSIEHIINNIISEKCLNHSDRLTFRDAALFCAFLNCTPLIDLFFVDHPLICGTLLRANRFVLRLYSASLCHQFHVARLLNQYLKIIYDYRAQVLSHFIAEPANYRDWILSLVRETLSRIDNDWESPISGMGNAVKQAYRQLIELLREPMRECESMRRFLIEHEYRQICRLPFSCKAKYRKLAILVQVFAAADDAALDEDARARLLSSPKSDDQFAKSIEMDEKIKFVEIPFYADSRFARQTIRHLSVNSLANAIADFYKSSIMSICEIAKSRRTVGPEETGEITEDEATTIIWSRHWLDAITHLFAADSSLSQSVVVQNALLAHIFPITLRYVPNSITILMRAFAGSAVSSPYGQVSIARIYFEQNASSSISKSAIEIEMAEPEMEDENENYEISPEIRRRIAWLRTVMLDGDDMTRAEALTLLVDEKFIPNCRPLICRLVIVHLNANLNIDNASFRQRTICKLEQFYAKLINSVSDRYATETTIESFDLIAESDQTIIRFIADSLNICALSLTPGSSFQRKFTALSLFDSVMTAIEKEDSNGGGAWCRLLRALFEFDFRNGNGKSIVDWARLLLLGIVDKDDKIRRLAAEVLIHFWRSPLSRCTASAASSTHFDDQFYRNLIWQNFLRSPRHQETHIGALLLKCLFRARLLPNFAEFSADELSASSPASHNNCGFRLITDLIETARRRFYSPQFRANLLAAAEHDPLHGYFLALNQCLTFASFYDGICAAGEQSSVPSGAELREKIFQPCIRLSLDCLDYFLRLLTPRENADKNGGDDYFCEDDDDDGEDYCSPSFLEMCRSIEQVIAQSGAQTKNEKNQEEEEEVEEKEEDGGDIFQSNDFQLILSMCWLNIKENCFLLTTLAALFADIVTVIRDEDDPLGAKLIQEQKPQQQSQLNHSMISAPEMLEIGRKIVSVMQRCRHKGVIEASGVALTKFTRTFLRIRDQQQSMELRQKSEIDGISFDAALESFVGEILRIVDFSRPTSTTNNNNNNSSSVTRRSAGLALIVQAVLVGEAEAIYFDGISPINSIAMDENSCQISNSTKAAASTTLYDRVISLLLSIATTTSTNLDDDHHNPTNEMNDLPQSNAMHILRSIVCTSALSHLSGKTVEQLFPLCVTHGFRSPHWQIRNASLQLFGACVTRMTGQKKRVKASGENIGAAAATITFEEFAARYPSLVSVIITQLNCCILSSTSCTSLHPELVPILALLASFTPIGSGDPESKSEFRKAVGAEKRQMAETLTRYLSNPIWKIRMLAARSLLNLWSIGELEQFIIEWDRDCCGREREAVTCNQLHGMLCCVSNLFESIGMISMNNRIDDDDNNVDNQEDDMTANYRVKYWSIFRRYIDAIAGKCPILVDLCAEIFRDRTNDSPARVIDGDDDDQDDDVRNETNKILAKSTNQNENDQQTLAEIFEKVNFKMSDDIRHQAAIDLHTIIENNNRNRNSSYNENNNNNNNNLIEKNLPQFVEIMLTLLEDEDREVRVVAQKIVTGLYRENERNNEQQKLPLHAATRTIAQYASIDYFFRWLNESPQRRDRSVPYLLNRLIEKCAQKIDDEEMFSPPNQSNRKRKIILFEREEKNVYAEPYRMAIRIGRYLESAMMMMMKKENQNSHDHHRKFRIEMIARLRTVVLDSGRILKHPEHSNLCALMSYSIWRLPDIVCRITNRFVAIRLFLSLTEDDDDDEDEDTKEIRSNLREIFFGNSKLVLSFLPALMEESGKTSFKSLRLIN